MAAKAQEVATLDKEQPCPSVYFATFICLQGLCQDVKQADHAGRQATTGILLLPTLVGVYKCIWQLVWSL